jgi:hypothetical protein
LILFRINENTPLKIIDFEQLKLLFHMFLTNILDIQNCEIVILELLGNLNHRKSSKKYKDIETNEI